MGLSAEQKQINLERRRKEKYSKTHKIINGIDHKFCNAHHTYFPSEDPWFPATLDYFYKNNTSGVDGLNPYCKNCGSQKAIQQWKDDPVKHREAHKKYEKTEKFKRWMHKNQIDMRDYRKEYWKKNKHKNKQYTENHRKHDIINKEWVACKNFFKDDKGIQVCAYCGLPLENHYRIYADKLQKIDFNKEHVDHEGYNDIRNCVPSCNSCNSTKRTRPIQELFDSGDIPEFTQDKYNKIIQWCTDEYKKYIEEKPPYIIKRSRVYNENGTYNMKHELWSVDEKRNMVECIAIRDKKKEIIDDLKNGKITIPKIIIIKEPE